MEKNNGDKGQASIEFSIAFIIALLFLVLTCRLFVWFNGNLVRRQLAYENSRVEAGSGDVYKKFLWFTIKEPGTRGKVDFYKSLKLDLFGKEIFKEK